MQIPNSTSAMHATCSIDGCNGRLDSHGLCGKHAQRLRRYGDPLYVTPEAQRRANNRTAQLARVQAVRPDTYRKRHGRHEHRVVAEQMLGRPLAPGEIVHHVDGNKHNNDPSNLQVMSQSEHLREHLHANARRIDWNGESLFPSEWAKRLGISKTQFHNRLRLGWSMERIAATPVAKRTKRNG